jgi:hypothetical protein
MQRLELVFVLCALLISCGGPHPMGYPGMKPLTGQFDITGATPVDPPANEPRNTHFRVYLTGEAARTLYESMKVRPQRSICGEDLDSFEKTIGEMMCAVSKNGTAYKCWFAIDLEKQQISGGWAC